MTINIEMRDGWMKVSLLESSANAPQLQSRSQEWRTVIVGLPILRKLLNGEDVTIESFHISMIPDDVLFNKSAKHKDAAEESQASSIGRGK